MRSPPSKAEVPLWIPFFKEQRHCVLLGTVEHVMTQSLRVESPYSGEWRMVKLPPFVPAPFVYSRLLSFSAVQREFLMVSELRNIVMG